MKEEEFKSLMLHAETLRGLSVRPEYYEGYMQGLQRRYYGEKFGTFAEHEKWLSLYGDEDQARGDRGRGYRDGLQGIRPEM